MDSGNESPPISPEVSYTIRENTFFIDVIPESIPRPAVGATRFDEAIDADAESPPISPVVAYMSPVHNVVYIGVTPPSTQFVPTLCASHREVAIRLNLERTEEDSNLNEEDNILNVRDPTSDRTEAVDVAKFRQLVIDRLSVFISAFNHAIETGPYAYQCVQSGCLSRELLDLFQKFLVHFSNPNNRFDPRELFFGNPRRNTGILLRLKIENSIRKDIEQMFAFKVLTWLASETNFDFIVDNFTWFFAGKQKFLVARAYLRWNQKNKT
jgi:hypothetical protein